MLNKIIVIIFAALLLGVVGEIIYYFAIQKNIKVPSFATNNTIATSAGTASLCKSAQQLAKADKELSKIRTQPPEYYLVDRSFINLYALATKDPGQRMYSVMEKVGIVQNLQLDNAKSPERYCFTLVNGKLADNYCFNKKRDVVFYEDSSNGQKTVSYITLKNNDNVRLIVKEDMGKPNKDSFVETKLQILNNP